MKKNSHSLENKKIKVLILSDRLQDKAKILADYLAATGDFDILGIAENRQQALSIAQKYNFDYLIIAGYLKIEYNYSVIAELRRQNKAFLAVQWAMIDSLINGFCQCYKIPLKFERTLPMADFVSFLDAHKNDPLPDFGEEA